MKKKLKISVISKVINVSTWGCNNTAMGCLTRGLGCRC